MKEINDTLLVKAATIFNFDISTAHRIPSHEGGRNVVFAIGNNHILRISNLNDRTLEDYLAETEFVHYLAQNGATVADAIPSSNGRLVEVIEGLAISMFQRAMGDQLVDHGYQYIDGRPIEELWYNTGKTLGKMHELSKHYNPENKRFDFFDKYNEKYFENLISDSLECFFISNKPIGRQVKAKLHDLLDKLRELPTDKSSYGMIHFDYSDGNYNIDYNDGTINVFDFDNCRTGWYLFDLANLWAHGVGWIAWNDNPNERKTFMERYFNAVCEGYRSQTELSEEMLKQLPLMVDAVRLENIIDEFEVELAEDGAIECDGEQAYRLRGLLEDVPFMGFLSDDFDPESPFDLDI